MNINKLNSSRCLLHIFLLLLTLCIGCGQKTTTEGILINDISKLNPTYVKDIMPARHVDSLQKAVLKAQEMGLKISISGRRHSQGGHAFYPDAVVLDMTYFNQILNLDIENNQVTAGQSIWSIKVSADYDLSRNLTALFFYDHNFSKFAISTAFPQNSIRSGITIRYNFGN